VASLPAILPIVAHVATSITKISTDITAVAAKFDGIPSDFMPVRS
jgi:hypothetical protein